LNREIILFDVSNTSKRIAKRATRVVEKSGLFFRGVLFVVVVVVVVFRVIIRLKRRRAKEIYNTHTHKRVLYHHLQREKSARKEVHTREKERE
jgi:uncharacterized ion transporter superfamily protein YfcC